MKDLWKDAPEWAQWVAQDEYGITMFCELEPRLDKNGRWAPNTDGKHLVSPFVGDKSDPSLDKRSGYFAPPVLSTGKTMEEHRMDFEEWFTRDRIIRKNGMDRLLGTGEYIDFVVNSLWESWKAALGIKDLK